MKNLALSCFLIILGFCLHCLTTSAQITALAPIRAASQLAAIPVSAAPLRVDINSENRADMRTIGWEN